MLKTVKTYLFISYIVYLIVHVGIAYTIYITRSAPLRIAKQN